MNRKHASSALSALALAACLALVGWISNIYSAATSMDMDALADHNHAQVTELPAVKKFLNALIATDPSAAALQPKAENVPAETIACSAPGVIDGSTLECDTPGRTRSGKTLVHLGGISAPPVARAELAKLAHGAVSCTLSMKTMDSDAYIGRCFAGGKDLSCTLLAAGFAVRKEGDTINCQ